MVRATTTGERELAVGKSELVKEANRIEESLLHSSKRHFEDAKLWGWFHYCLGIPTVVMAAIMGTVVLNQMDPTQFWAGILSILVTVLTAISTFLNPNQRESAHFSAGNKYDALLNEVRLYRTIECWNETDEAILQSKLKSLSDRKSQLNEFELAHIISGKKVVEVRY